MKKRITMICNQNRDLTQVNWTIRDFLKSNNIRDYHNIEMHSFLKLDEPAGNFVIGHYGKGEILAVFDRRIVPEEDRIKGLTPENRYERTLKALYTSTINLCNEQEIPYIIYAGEFLRGKEKEFLQKLDSVKEQIIRRLENAV